jgi:HSP20 family protein
MVRWDPFNNVTALQDRINRLFDDAFPTRREFEEDVSKGDWRPAVDIYDTDEAVVIHVELPGISKENISVEVRGNVLTLRGEKSINKDFSEENCCRQERCYGTFQRAFTLPSSINSQSIKASFKDGILELKIPKPEEERPTQITVNIE